MPNLTFMWLMTDHTGATGVNGGSTSEPDPVAQAADNDLAVGRVVDSISHSKFWKSTAVFVDEDDTQNGVDHVDGHRAPTLVISPYSHTGVDDQYYTQLNMVKTVEQILGIKPMNQEDEAAEPMYSAFTDQPDFAPYNLVQNIVPLNSGLPVGRRRSPRRPLRQAPSPRPTRRPRSAPRAPFQAAPGASMTPGRPGSCSRAPRATSTAPTVNADQLNRYDWYSAHDWAVAYPGDPKIYLPNQVPGRKLPAAFIGN
jgi:hypothetical protein